ncbi:hypothetical protein M405DRAFT_813388 [Rhizopogon salebrosus TDB-379]|nr:hypothetical protein M405DRAFT_813388 [Rhizopogon salebrosus TDB-379]
MLFQDAMEVFDLAFMFINGDSKTIYLVRLIKAIAVFNASLHEEAILFVQKLAAYPDADTLAYRVVQAFLYVQLGTNALEDARHDEAARHFTAAINTGAFSSERTIQSRYEIFVVLFGWDLKSLWGTANQKRCYALLRAGRLAEARGAYQYMIDMGDEITKTTYRDSHIAFEQECCTLYSSNGDDALAAKDYDKSIELYSAAIDLDSTNDSIFAKRCTAKLGKMLWEDALIDVQKVIELNPSSYVGYELKHAALFGARQYDDATAAFEIMQSKLNNAPDTELRRENITLSEAESAIREVIDALVESTPHRLLNTLTWGLYDWEAQIDVFKTSVEYKELLSLTMKRTNLRKEHIEQVVERHFRYVMLSHMWEENEPLLHDIHGRDIHGKKTFGSSGGITKLKSFCKTARDAGYRWAWVDTCCIDHTNNVEVQQSVNSMFVWYRHAALTIVYLSDVPPSSKSGALAMSVWNTRGWTVQEFLASEVVLFYQKDWTLYLDDRSPNHKNSAAIMRELEDATGIDSRALVNFHPGMRGAREKLQWASARVTTLPEDMAYSLFGIFGVRLPVIYGEGKQHALRRLLQEIVAQSGDITALDWVGKSSEFNSCLPADITSYKMPAWTSLSSPEDEIQAAVFSLRNTVPAELASALYTSLDNLYPPRFAPRSLHLPGIVFPVTEIRQRRNQDHANTYEVQARGLNDQLITTEDTLMQFSLSKPLRQKFLLVRPWDRSLLDLDLPDLSDTVSANDLFPLVSPLRDSLGESLGENEDSKSYQQALRLIVRLGQPFSAFLLAQQRGGEYKRIASDYNIIAQVKDMASVNDMMDVRTLEIL